MDFILQNADTFIWIAVAFGFLMAFGVGANDVANAMGTSVGAKALTLKQAIFVAAIFEFAGAYLAGGQVTQTIRKGIIDSAYFEGTPELLIFGMMAALLAAGVWLVLASKFGWPVSTTHSIIGAIVGFAAVGVSVDAVSWGKVGSIVGSWVITPFIAGAIAFLIVMSVQKLILNRSNPFAMAKRYVPFYMFLTGFVMALVTIMKGLKHIFQDHDINLSMTETYLIAIGFGALIAVIGALVISRIKVEEEADKDYHFYSVEKVFTVLMIVTACGMAFAHGSNDVANAIGPLAAIVSVIQNGGDIGAKAVVDPRILLVGAIGIVIGLIVLGSRVMATIGQKITHLTPSRGFAAELAAASTVIIASGAGLPISTTQTLVGAVLGVGMARGIAALNLGVVRNILVSWVVTLPAGAILSVIFFFIFKALFSF
ncbi:inorganic phosphate transporter [Kangiella koreensis]|uniref:Phosphate transporter n=1 Tax=Kangiella koreensis (strain DSM 16069 / JCM 12317 / KCTC 12182 / SW-125) TaxID=523791 RepID=C7R7M9_KANKD|nr:inorganic phosphate transporter [Kangiella koreensis]ACV27562.1 phosphate transporter [Kangiella koreensis DSM 16069]